MRTYRPTINSSIRLLLATGLSVRCDRWLACSAQIAGDWQARPLAFNVLDPSVSDRALARVRGKDDVCLSFARLKQSLASGPRFWCCHVQHQREDRGDHLPVIQKLY